MLYHKYGADLPVAVARRPVPCPKGKAEIEYVKTATFSTSNRLPDFLRYNFAVNVLAFEFIGYGYCDAERYRIRFTCFESP